MSAVKRVSCGLVFMFLSTGCTAYVRSLPKADVTSSCPPLQESQASGDVLVGVALSGGGSRAAVFGAGGLKALATLRVGREDRSLLEQVSYISSVSGGSFAATYFAMHKPKRQHPVLTESDTLTKEYHDFFCKYEEAMSQNFEWSTEWRQFVKPHRWLNPSYRATSLAEALDDHRFLNHKTLNDLYEREEKGDSPRLIINSTLYNNGRRFVITTLPEQAFDPNFREKIKKEFSVPMPRELEQALERLAPMSFCSGAIGADWRGVPLSDAVVASASFPPLIGPITAQVQGSKDKDSYWHVGDGGLFDNQGTESLVQVMLKRLEGGTAKRALIVALDSSYPFAVGNDQLAQNPKGFEVFIDDPGRIVGIMEERAMMYQALLWNILRSKKMEGSVLPDYDTIQVTVLRHTDAEWSEEDLKGLPEACRIEAKCRPASDGGRDLADACRVETRWDVDKIKQHIAEIPTRLEITECDKHLLLKAAAKVVIQKRGEIEQFLRAR